MEEAKANLLLRFKGKNKKQNKNKCIQYYEPDNFYKN